MTRHVTSLKRLLALGVLAGLELALRVLAKVTDRPQEPSREWTEDDHRAEW